jgi:hypothetical protein
MRSDGNSADSKEKKRARTKSEGSTDEIKMAARKIVHPSKPKVKASSLNPKAKPPKPRRGY